ncbi:MAG TPA: NRAMP family divalent metal transporter [Acidimicrobiales bacterium]|nr:NRAMP family divalent metal transporter [Acidimicrobiales bacterium]
MARLFTQVLPTDGSTVAMATQPEAVLDSAHVGDIRGALGTVRRHDIGERLTLSAKFKTLLAIVGPGLIVMVGDNDAGAFSTYTQAGQDYGTRLLWSLVLLVPVLYVNQEMVLRLGAVSGVGHARLILERFGRFWGAFSVIDLFVLNALTIVTEFIGITLAVGYLGLPKVPSVLLAALLVIGAASTGSFRRFERVCLALVAGSAVLIPIYIAVHPPTSQMAYDFVVPGLPKGSHLSTVMLLLIAIVGTTVAPWQLFFQQSYVIDKRITPRFIKYEKVDLWVGIVVVVVGAAAMFGFSDAIFAGRPGFGHFSSTAGVAQALGHYGSRLLGDLFAIALLDASIIGAAAVGLATAYAGADVIGVNHSLHRSVSSAKGFYAAYAGLMAIAAAVVLVPGAPLGLITEGVQTLAGVLLPSATVFLLLLCNDKDVLGPWVNSRRLNAFTSVVVWCLIVLSIVLTASVLFPGLNSRQILLIVVGGAGMGLVAGAYMLAASKRRHSAVLTVPVEWHDRQTWRMPALNLLAKPVVSRSRKVGLGLMRAYLVVAFALVVVKIVQVALG